MKTSLVSIVLCTYNGEKYLETQLDSLLAQDYPELEFVVVDDVSSDGTVDILQKYVQKDSRIRLFLNQVNLGFLKNFEYALTLARGEFVALSDQDDLWLPDKISKLYSAMGDNDLCYCDSAFMDGDGRLTGKKVSDLLNMYSGRDPAHFIYTNCVSGHALLVRSQQLRKSLPFPVGHYHDWWLAFTSASCGGVVYVDEALVQYRQHEAAITDLSGSRVKKKVSKVESVDKMIMWIQHLSRFESGHQQYLLDLYQAFAEWRNAYFSPRLAKLLFSKRKELNYIDSKSHSTNLNAVIRYFWGFKLKRLASPSRYT